MFGYLLVNYQKLSKEENSLYREHYCGLCHVLNDRYGSTGRNTLSYDLTFVSLILNSVYRPEMTCGEERCVMHPVRSHEYRFSTLTEFAADMNILLTYYKCLDDYHDDNSQKALRKAEKLADHVRKIEDRYPSQCQKIRECLNDNSEMERHNELNPDLPSNCFGNLMAEVFTFTSDEMTEQLRRFGFYLGKFIYLMDAAVDLKDDIRNQQYNALIQLDSDSITESLELVMDQCISEYEKLPVSSDIKPLIDNVLYSGIWTRYQLKYRRKERKH